MRDEEKAAEHKPAPRPNPVTYTVPRLTKYGTLAALTRSGTGTRMEGGGPSNKFA